MNNIKSVDASLNQTTSKTQKSKKDSENKDSFSDLMSLVGNSANNSLTSQNLNSTSDLKNTTDVNKTDYSSSVKFDTSSNDNLSDTSVKSSDSDYKSESNYDDKKDSTDVSQTSKSDDASKTDSTSKTEDTAKTDNVKETSKDDKVDDSDIEKVANAVSQIEDKLKEVLGVSDEDIASALDDMNLSEMDLLDADNLKAVALELSDSSELDLILDEDLNANISEVLDGLDEILSDNGISDTDFLLEEIKGDDDSVMNLTDKIVGKKESNSDENNADQVNSDNANTETVTQTDSSSEVNSNTNGENSQESFGENQQTFAETGITDTKSDVQVNTENLFNNLAQAVDNSSMVEEIVPDTEEVSTADIIQQVIDEIKSNNQEDMKSLQIRLNPESLGHLQISVSTKNGVMQAQIIAETEAAKNAIEEGLTLLKEAFNNQDLKVDAVEVTIANYEFFKDGNNQNEEQQNQKNSSNGGNSLGVNDDIKTESVSEADELEQSIMRSNGNSVSYSI